MSQERRFGRQHDRLFDDRDRSDASPKLDRESIYAFLNRVSRPESAAPRAVLEEWFARWPAADRDDLRGRLSAKEEHQFLGAFWELYLHEVHVRLGFECEREPELPDSPRRPDFLMRRASDSFYPEATLIGPPDVEVARRKRKQLVTERINGAFHPDFSVRVRAITLGENTPSKAAVARAVEGWLSSLDWDTECARASEVGRAPHAVEVSGSRLLLLPLPRPESARGDRSFPTVPMRRTGGGIINEPPFILDDLRDKAFSYGHPDRPFVIAALCARDFVQEHDVEQALYDPEEGLWQRATRGSAVMSAIHLNPWSQAQTPLKLWTNPRAVHPLEVSLPWATVSGDIGAKSLARTEATLAPHELLDLRPNWPY